MMKWYIGQKVVCIESRPLVFDKRETRQGPNEKPSTYAWPKLGEVYTIRSIHRLPYRDDDKHLLFWLEEIKGQDRVAFHEELFEPLSWRKRSMKFSKEVVS